MVLAAWVRRWKKERERLHGGVTYPVGAQPDGHSWTGFVTAAQDGGGYALIFRELAAESTWTVDVGAYMQGAARAEVIGGRGTAEIAGGTLRATVPERLDFVWVKIGR